MQKRILNLNWLICIFIIVQGCVNPAEIDKSIVYDLHIKNAQIVDGTGSAGKNFDLIVMNDTIAYLGQPLRSTIKSKKTIDATGKVITPGFIDIHAHGDPTETPRFENFLAMGVTTICLGQDGFSHQGSLENHLNQIDKQDLGINVAMIVGHSSLRIESGIGYSENPTQELLLKQQNLLAEAFELGVFGMSTGLEYSPGIFASEGELIPLAKIVGAQDAIIISHIRNEDDENLERSIAELLTQGQYCNVQLSHMKSVYGKGTDRGKELMKILEEANNDTFKVTADVYPYTASYTGIGIVFPEWAKAPNDYALVVKERRDELLEFLKEKIIRRNGPEATLFGTQPYAGKTLEQVAEEQEIPYEKVLMGIGPNKASGAYFIMDEELQEELIAHPMSMVSSDGSPTMRHPRGYGSFAKIIEEFVYARNRLSLEEAVRTMTSFPAKTLGLEKRGTLKPGYYADLLIFDPENIKANATYENPHLLATGFEQVFVNGTLVFEKGEFKEAEGRLLRKR